MEEDKTEFRIPKHVDEVMAFLCSDEIEDSEAERIADRLVYLALQKSPPVHVMINVYGNLRIPTLRDVTMQIEKFARMTRLDQVQPLLTTIGRGVQVKSSTLPNSGFGLFAAQRFTTLQPITQYTGKIMEWEVAKVTSPSHLITLFHGVWVINGKMTEDGGIILEPAQERIGKGGAAFANDQKDEPSKINAVYDHADSPDATLGDPRAEDRIMFLRAICPIEKGEEIFVNYGEDYWKKNGDTEQEEEET